MGKIKDHKIFKEKVFEMCDTLGFWNVRPFILEKKIGIPNQTISNWKQEYIKKHGIPDIKRYGKEMNVNAISALKELIKLMKDEDKKIRISAINTYFGSVERFTEFLERFGYKEKIAEKLEFEGGIEIKWKEPKKK